LYILEDRVCASRTDLNGIMKLAGAIDVIQDCSLLWIESEPSFRDFLAANNLGMFVVSRQADIIRLPAYGERITVRTSIFDVKGYLGYRNTAMYGEDGLPCVLTWSVGAFVNRDTGKMARLPQGVIDRIAIDDKIDMEYLDKKILLPDSPGRRLNAAMVRRSDIDFNRHMNNAKYIEAALEFLPEDFAVGRLRIEYKAPAKLGDLLYPKRMEDPSGKIYILLLNAQDQPFAVAEFSRREAEHERIKAVGKA